jgi:hypothetical protein
MGSLYSLRPKMARQVKYKVESMIIISFDSKGIVHKEFVLAGKTVNSAYYCDDYSNCVKICEDFTLNFGNKRTGCCIITMYASFFARELLTRNNKTVVLKHPTFLFP